MDEAKFREAEQHLWDFVGHDPTERRFVMATTGTEVRVQEVGQGDPVLFIHGGPNCGSTWAPMLRYFDGFHCLLVDRPGTGLSEPYPVTAANLASFGAGFVSGVLDGLEIPQAHVVASSFGGHLALRSAAAHPHRFRRMVQMAAPAMVPGAVYPPFMKLMTSRFIRSMMNLFPPTQSVNRSIFRQIGHGESLDAGLIPQVFLDWYLAVGRHTDTLRNDGDPIGSVVPAGELVTLSGSLLASVTTPTLFLWGNDDGFGGEDNARLVSGLLPNARLVMLPNAGHLPWLDDPGLVAERTADFLAADVVAPSTRHSSRPTGGRRKDQ
jgi:2-hydroxy-6-oxonona-2,4-dienedioate hydrolase